jgi:hypothetical protein
VAAAAESAAIPDVVKPKAVAAPPVAPMTPAVLEAAMTALSVVLSLGGCSGFG